jgi:glutamyl-tRNA synthetase
MADPAPSGSSASPPAEPVVVRFAPSPTGYLHIGAARTALFNWLFARHHGGIFLLRIEDTDRVRSTAEAVQAILDGLRWLGIDWDGEPLFQFARAARHAEAARQLLADGRAYRCFATPDELDEMRRRAKAEGRPMRYDGRWRDRDPGVAPAGVAPVVRFRAPQSGETRIDDLVQGPVTVANAQLDDMVLLRADGTPTYMLACVVDDHDMGITHIVRGDDHLTNAFRQYRLFRAFGWPAPRFAHIPLIHGADGQKLSKRHGAVGLEAYREQGFLPEAVCNYLLRLGWSHGDDEIIGRARAIEWFDLDHIGRSPARFDLDKLTSLNAHYLRTADAGRLLPLILDGLAAELRDRLSADAAARLARGLKGLMERAKTLVELRENARFYAVDGPPAIGDNDRALLTEDVRRRLSAVVAPLAELAEWTMTAVEAAVRACCAEEGWKLKDVAQPLRVVLTGSRVSPPLFEVMEVLGRRETLARLEAVLVETPSASNDPGTPPERP